MKMSKKIPIAGVLTPSADKNSGRSPESAVWNLRLSLGKTLQGAQLREIEWAPAKEAPAVLVPEENAPQEYGHGPWAAAFGRAAGRFGVEAFVLHSDGRLRWEAWASLHFGKVRQENAFTRAGRLPGLPDRLSALFSARAVPGFRGESRPCPSSECGSSSLASTGQG